MKTRHVWKKAGLIAALLALASCGSNPLSSSSIPVFTEETSSSTTEGSSSATGETTSVTETSSSEEDETSENTSDEEIFSSEESEFTSETSEEESTSSEDSSSSGEQESSSGEQESSSVEEVSSSSKESSSSSQEEYDGPAIVFNSGKTGSSSLINNLKDCISVRDVSVDSASSERVYGSDDSSVRVGSSRNVGSLTFTFAETISILDLAVVAKSYQNDGSVGVNVSNGVINKSLTVSAEKSVYSLYESFGESDSLTISNAKEGKRFYLYEIRLTLGEIVPVYPTSISVEPSEVTINEGSKKTLSVSYLPETTNVKELSFESSDITVASVSERGQITGEGVGDATITVKAVSETGFVSDTVSVHVLERATPAEGKVAMQQTYVDYTANCIYGTDSAPTTGEVHPLVIPVWFTNSSDYIKTEQQKKNVRDDIETAYFGSTSETGWHSVKTFYETESRGKMTIEGVCTDWYPAGKSSSSYGSENAGASNTEALVKTASDWYFSQPNAKPRTYFDTDSDGFLDAVLLIYGSPDYMAMNKQSSSYTNFWAYCYWLSDFDLNSVINPGPNTFFWASYDFMYGSSSALSRSGSNYSNGDTNHCAVDAHTFIHEMGHVFGLDDYYNYGESTNPAAGFSMQDANVGGHDPFSVMSFGWVDPYIPTESTTLEISPFQESGDLILLSSSWNEFDSPFDEYLLLELYTPTGLNALDATYTYAGNYPKGPNMAGIRLWHVDARLLYVTQERSDYPVYSASQMTNDANYDCEYGVITAFTNTSGNESYGSPLGSNYDNYNLLQLIRNKSTAVIKDDSYLSASDLFTNGSSFSISKFTKQFVKGSSSKWNNGKSFDWSFSVSITGTGSNVKATIDLVKE